jgi:ubiquinone/menaquinone biosynthesis C-methylase UbiE
MDVKLLLKGIATHVPMFMSNKNVWETQAVVRSYSIQSHLQKPEETILNNFKSRLKNMKMLDIGVGGGRTTCHFANLVKEYVGIDYSENMINACKKRFPAPSQNIFFKICDVRSMNILEDNYFDFVLFSFNGIDCMSHEDRLKALREIQRVGKPRGFFCFQTHNLQALDKLFTVRLSVNPIRMSREILRCLLLRFLNKSLKKSEKYAIIIDGACRFRLATYYIKPEEQIKQLSEGFEHIRVYSLADGKEIVCKQRLYAITDRWLYYLCNIK